jgi:hypothetical protein
LKINQSLLIKKRELKMKKILLTIMAGVLTTLSVNAQVDYGFETWVTASGAAQNPTGWASFNVLTAFGMKQTVFKDTAAPYVGKAAARIVTQPVVSPIPIPGGYDTVGILAIGVISATGIQFGTPYTNRPQVVHFATKYQPVGSDTGFVTVALTKFNTTTSKIDIIASGIWNTTATSTSWTAQALTLTYAPGLMNVAPDSIKIMASSSSLYRPKVGSTFYIDDITMTGYVSTNNIDGVENNVSVYPAPAKESVSFSISVKAYAVQIMDITGRNLGVFPMTNNKVTIETANYKAGMYIYNVVNEQGKALGRGKFEVVK